jgi:hypothetical protein
MPNSSSPPRRSCVVAHGQNHFWLTLGFGSPALPRPASGALTPDGAPLNIEAASVRQGNEFLFHVAFLVMDMKEQERLSRFLSHLPQNVNRGAS